MKNLWDESEAAEFANNPLALRVYSSRLLGAEADLVLHGGGNTSVKVDVNNLFGEPESILYVKGSGWDLASIEEGGFAPVRMETLLRMAELDALSDVDMVQNQKAAMTNPSAPNPSVEAILHALIPFKHVDHTHADAVVAITNTPDGEATMRKIYSDKVLYVPYVMPGFILSKTIRDLAKAVDWTKLEGIILLNHGIFSFSDNAKTSYDNMIRMVSQAEDYIAKQGADQFATSDALDTSLSSADLKSLALMRKQVSKAKGKTCFVSWDRAPQSIGFSNLSNMESLATRGTLTPDHVIRTKQKPWIVTSESEQLEQSLADYEQAYTRYFKANASEHHTMLNSAPCWAIWPGRGHVTFGSSIKETHIIRDIAQHTVKSIQTAEALGGWEVLSDKDLFDMEYWSLEQAKVGKVSNPLPLQGKIALVTGSFSGIGKVCVETLFAQGAAVIAVDIKPKITDLYPQTSVIGLQGDLTNEQDIKRVVETAVSTFGGLDILVNNAGVFSQGQNIEDMSAECWDQSMQINLTAQQRVLQAAIPYLKIGVEPAVIFVASKNVPAPGPGAAAYSVAKAGMTQLARVAALELGEYGIPVNIIHPNAVFDTALWTEEVLAERAKHYGISVEAYKSNNVLGKEITSADVANLVCAMAGLLFAKSTGNQIAIDGGNERVI